MKCYYGCTPEDEDLWQCRTCEEYFCMNHNHSTDHGENVECVGCERERLENNSKICFKCKTPVSFERKTSNEPEEAEHCFSCSEEFCPNCIEWAEPYDGSTCKDCAKLKTKGETK